MNFFVKQLLFLVVLIVHVSIVGAQNLNAIQKGTFVVETGVNLGTSLSGFSYLKSNSEERINIGGHVGYFILDNLAVKAGLGYAKASTTINFGEEAFGMPVSADFETAFFTYNVGVKYYFGGRVPLQLSYAAQKDPDENRSLFNRNSVDLLGGYAWFVMPRFSIEPTIGYSLGINNENKSNRFGANIGFSVFL